VIIRRGLGEIKVRGYLSLKWRKGKFSWSFDFRWSLSNIESNSWKKYSNFCWITVSKIRDYAIEYFEIFTNISYFSL